MSTPPPRGGVVVLTLFLVVILGGCTALSGEPTRTTTVTPATVPGDDPPVTPVPTVAPGVPADGTIEPAAVVNAHERALANRSYTFTLRRTVRDGTETRQETYVRTLVAAGGTPFRLVQFVNVSRQESVATSGDRVVDVFFDGSVAFVRVTDSTGTPYIRDQSIGREALTDPAFPDLHRDLLATARFDGPTGTDADAVRLVADSLTDPTALGSLSPGSDPANGSLSVVVTRTGIVRETRLAFDDRIDGDRVRVVQITHVSALDRTTVPVPEWVPSNATGPDNATVTTTGDSVSNRTTGGN